MPRNGSGSYSPPANINPVISGTTIDADWANTTISDISNGLSGSLPRNGEAPMTGPLKIAEGSVGAPGLSFNADASTGFYRPSTGVLAITAAGIEQGRFTDGKFLLGTTVNNGSKLQVNGTSTFAGDVTITGNLSSTGTSSLAGNQTISGTLGVTGQTTLSGGLIGTAGFTDLGSTRATTLSVTGTGSVIGLLNAGSLSVNGNTSTNSLNVSTTSQFNGNAGFLTTITAVGGEAMRMTNGNAYISAFNAAGTVRLGYLEFTSSNASVNLAAENGNSVNLRTNGRVVLNASNSGVISTLGPLFASTALDSQVSLGDDGNGAIEIGKVGRAVAGTPFIDFHSSTTAGLDYDARIITSGGGTSNGKGTIGFVASRHQIFGSSDLTFFDSAAVNALDYLNGNHQRWAPATGAQTLSIINWPIAGRSAALFIEGVNLGASTITWPASAKFIKSDGTEQTTLAATGVVLQTAGTDRVLIWTRDAGANIYVKVMR